MLRFLKMFSLFFLLPFLASAQPWTTFPGDNACGAINPNVTYCPGSSNSFCVGDSVGFGSGGTSGSVDSSFIAWGDGTINVYPNNFSGCVYNTYKFRPDSCVTNGFLKVDIVVGFYDTCAAGYSLNSFGTSIYIKFRPHAEFTATPSTICVDEPVTFNLSKTCSNANNLIIEYAHYSWDMGNGNVYSDSTLGAVNPPPPPYDTYTVPGTYTITLTITNNCATSVYAKQIIVRPPTVIAPSIVADSCAPASFQPTMIASNVLTYQWSSNPTAAINNDTIAQPIINVTSPGLYIFNVTATGCCFLPSGNCNWSDTLKFDQGPWLTPQAAPPTLCDSGDLNPLNFFAINDPDTVIISYQWSFPGGSPANDNSANPPLINYSSPGVYPLTLIVTSPCGNDTIIDSLHVYQSPQVSITSSALNDCDSIGITFNNTSVVSQNYSWSVPSPGVFVPPTNSSSASPIISYNVPGNYDVILSATTNAVCPAATDTFRITLLPGPNVQLTSFIPDSCITATLAPLNYFNISGSVASYSWLFPGGNPSSDNTANPPAVLYDTLGTYVVTLIATDAMCGSDSITDTFYVSAPPSLTVTPDSLSGCGTLTVTFTNTSPANQTYFWTTTGTFTNGNNTSPAPTIFYGAPGSDIISVVASSAGCPSTSPQNFAVSIGESPQLFTTALLPVADGCDSNFVFQWFNYFAFNPSPSDSGYSWQVFLNNVNIYNNISVNPPDFQALNTGEYIITASVWNNCDTILLTDTFNVFQPATLQLPGDTIVCKDYGIYLLTANPTGGNWYLNGNTTPLAVADFDPSIAVNDSNKLVYIYAEGTNCQTSDSFLIIVSGLNISAGSDIALCNNIGLYQLTGGTPVNGAWSGTAINNPTSSGQYNVALIPPAGDTLVYSYTDAGTTCITKDTILITVNIPTSAQFILPDTVCEGDVVQFNNLSPNTNTYWDFGDATATDTNTVTTHIYNIDDTYLVSLIILDLAGCRDTLQDSIAVLRPPDASFTTDTNTLCAGLPLHVTNLSSFTSYTSYIWNYGNGITDTTFIPDTIYFSQAQGTTGTYNIILQTLNRCGVAGDSHPINILQVPFANAGYSQGDGCSPDTVEFSNISQGGSGQYVWYIDNTPISSDSALLPQVFTADSLGAIYYLTLTATNICGIDSFFDSIVINPSIVYAFFSMSNTAICKNDTLELVSYSTPGSYIYWDLGDGSTATGDTINYAYNIAGVYNITQIAYGCGLDTANRFITIHEIPKADFTVPPVTCNKDTLQFDNISTSVNSFGSIWHFGDGTTSSFTDPIHQYADSGLYTITLFVTDAPTGCRDSTQQSVLIVADPLASFYIPNPDGCNHTIALVNNSTYADHFIWNMGNGDVLTDEAPVYTYPDTGAFTVTLLASNSNQCTDDTSYSYVYVLPVPHAEFTPDPYHQSILNPHFNFINLSSGDSIISHAWYFGDGTAAYSFEPTHFYSDTGLFNVKLIVTNIYNCADSLIQEVEVDPEFVFYIANSFTPDGDGNNDYFNVKGWYISQARLTIFNRWGEKVFETDDYEKGWDGRYKDRNAEQGVYIYYIKATDPDGVEYKKKGSFTLIR